MEEPEGTTEDDGLWMGTGMDEVIKAPTPRAGLIRITVHNVVLPLDDLSFSNFASNCFEAPAMKSVQPKGHHSVDSNVVLSLDKQLIIADVRTQFVRVADERVHDVVFCR